MSRPAVLIVGAGPAGLTLAIELARRAVAFRLIDAAPTHFPGSRGKGLQPRTLEVFDDLGVLDEVLATGSPYPMIRAYQDGKVVMERHMGAVRPVTPHTPYPNAWLLPQNITERILRGRLADLGGQVELGTELVTFTQDEHAVTATLRRDGATEEVAADYLVGTDGGRSTVRRRAGIAFLGETREAQRMVIADVRVPGLDRDHWHFWGPSMAESVGLCPLSGTDLFVLQAAVLGDADVTPDAAGIRNLFQERSGADLELGDLVWASAWRANIRLAERFRQGRVLLAGDAAHAHSPTGGQGLNTSIQDAYNLGWKLAARLSGATDDLLDTYQAERLPVASEVLGISTDLLDRSVSGDEAALSRDDPDLAQLHISYRSSTLSRDERPSPGQLHAGDRAPDAPCRTADGTPTSLFSLFRTPRPTVLTFGTTNTEVPGYTVTDDPTVPNALLDPEGHLRAAYDTPDGTVMVIRPDGHIGLMTPDPAQVAPYLASIAPTAPAHL